MIDHVAINRSYWDDYAPHWVTRGEAAWLTSEPYWGIWETPEADLNLLPSNLEGLPVSYTHLTLPTIYSV